MQAVAVLLQYSINKLQVLNRGRIIGPAEIVIQLAVVGVSFAKCLCGNSGGFKSIGQTSSLGVCVGVSGEVQQEKRGDVFVFGNVRYGGEADVFFGIITEFLAVSEGKHFAAVQHLSVFGSGDDFGNVVGVPIHRDTAFQRFERNVIFCQPAFVGAEDGGQLGAG